MGIRPEIEQAIADCRFLSEQKKFTLEEKISLESELRTIQNKIEESIESWMEERAHLICFDHDLTTEYEQDIDDNESILAIGQVCLQSVLFVNPIKTRAELRASLSALSKMNLARLEVLKNSIESLSRVLYAFLRNQENTTNKTDDVGQFLLYAREECQSLLSEYAETGVSKRRAQYRRCVIRLKEISRLLRYWRGEIRMSRGVRTLILGAFFRVVKDAINGFTEIGASDSNISSKEVFDVYHRRMLEHCVALDVMNDSSFELKQVGAFLMCILPLVARRESINVRQDDLSNVERYAHAERVKALDCIQNSTLSFEELLFLVQTEEDSRGELSKQIWNFVHDQRRFAERYFIALWFSRLLEGVGKAFQRVGVDSGSAYSLLIKLINISISKDVKRIIRQAAPELSSETIRAVAWIRHFARTASKGDLLDDTCQLSSLLQDETKENEFLSWIMALDNLEARESYYRTITEHLCGWGGVNYGEELIPNTAQKATMLRSRHVDVQESVEKQSVEPSVKGIVGIIYFPRLSPMSDREIEEKKLSGVYCCRPFELNIATVSGSEESWTNEVLTCITQGIARYGKLNTGDPRRIAKQLFEYLLSPPRPYTTYADGAHNFHPAGGSKDYYIICRVLSLSELGEWLVWRFGKTEEERRR